ncbi:iron ABC transporter permease [Gibbsiella dentisursi]
MSIRIRMVLLCALGGAAVLLALCTGPFSLSLTQILHLMAPEAIAPADRRLAVVFWQVRLPRVAGALLIGAALSAAGAAYQGMFRNPLVSPDILGVSAGAGMGASIAIFLGLPMLMIQLLAFFGGLAAVIAVCLIARLATRHDPVLSLVLVGIAIGTLCGAVISLIKILADPYLQLPSITFWLLGGLSTLTPADLLAVAPALLLGMIPMLLLRWRVNLLSLPDDEARTLGVNVARLRLVLILCATLVTAAAVSVAGIIGWIGLVVPHISRLLVGADHRYLLPAAMGCGALLLLLTDTLARSIAAIELPLGILTALVGAPFFLALLLGGGRR